MECFLLDTMALTRILFAMFCVSTVVFGAALKDESGAKLGGNGIEGVNWNERGRAYLQDELAKKNNDKVAKNIIFFIGDGMGITTVTAARILKGQKAQKIGELSTLNFEMFPHVGLSKTFSNDMQVTASAAAASAMLSGTKVSAGTIGLGPENIRGNCDQVQSTRRNTILDWSMAKGKMTGVVSTTRVTHATPAASFAHSADRNWESDSDQPNDANLRQKCPDIATQLVRENPNINVVLGGGRRSFYPNTTADPEHPTKYGNRQDGKNLVQEWITEKQNRNVKHSYVWNQTSFNAVDIQNIEYLLGLFSPSHMAYELDRKGDVAKEPSLSEMVDKAIRILRRSDKGFFLLVEGGRIDHAHHENLAQKALDETLMMDEAVKTAVELTDESDTLIIVTGDHSHPFTIGSWASVNNNILGVVDEDGIKFDPTDDGQTYLTLGYANGPGPYGRIENITSVNYLDKDFQSPTLVKMTEDTHGGEDVAIYARGPMSHLINGVKENQYIAHVMAFSACVGAYDGKCERPAQPAGATGTGIRYDGTAALIITCIYWLKNMI